MKDKKLWIIILMFIMIAIPKNFVEAQEAGQEEVLTNELSEQEVKEILEEESQNIQLFSSPTLKLILKKDKGMVKIAYSVSGLPSKSNVKLSPLVLKKKSGVSWKSIVSWSPYKNNVTTFSGGYCYMNPSLNTTYKAYANFDVTRNGNKNRYYKTSNTITF